MNGTTQNASSPYSPRALARSPLAAPSKPAVNAELEELEHLVLAAEVEKELESPTEGGVEALIDAFQTRRSEAELQAADKALFEKSRAIFRKLNQSENITVAMRNLSPDEKDVLRKVGAINAAAAARDRQDFPELADLETLHRNMFIIEKLSQTHDFEREVDTAEVNRLAAAASIADRLAKVHNVDAASSGHLVAGSKVIERLRADRKALLKEELQALVRAGRVHEQLARLEAARIEPKAEVRRVQKAQATQERLARGEPVSFEELQNVVGTYHIVQRYATQYNWTQTQQDDLYNSHLVHRHLLTVHKHMHVHYHHAHRHHHQNVNHHDVHQHGVQKPTPAQLAQVSAGAHLYAEAAQREGERHMLKHAIV